MQDLINKNQPIKSYHVALEKNWKPLQTSINRGSQLRKKKEEEEFLEIQISFRQAFQARKLSQKFSNLLRLRLKSTKNKTLLDQSKCLIRVFQQHFEDKSKVLFKA